MASKKQQKAGFPLPNPIDGWPLLDICLKIPNAPEYRRAFIGHINQLGLWAIWEKSYEPGDTRARDAAQIWRRVLNDYLDMGCTDMNCCCDDPPAIYRFDADGNLERSTDGGTTWTPAPGFDPRQNGTLFPPVPDDDKCQAATNVKHHMKDKADQLAADSGAWAGISELIGAMIGILIFVGIIGSGGLLTPLMMALAGAILWTGQAAFSAAMTTTVYDTFKCIVFCHVADDGSFTDGQISAIISDINMQLTGIAATYLSKTVQALGRVGMTNMARTGSGETGDCSACDCTCPTVYDWFDDSTVTPDDLCQYAGSSHPESGSINGIYLGSIPGAGLTFPVSPGFKVISATASEFLITVGYYNLDGTVVTGHGPDPSATVAAVFFETNTPFTWTVVIEH